MSDRVYYVVDHVINDQFEYEIDHVIVIYSFTVIVARPAPKHDVTAYAIASCSTDYILALSFSFHRCNHPSLFTKCPCAQQ